MQSILALRQLSRSGAMLRSSSVSYSESRVLAVAQEKVGPASLEGFCKEPLIMSPLEQFSLLLFEFES